MKKLKGFEIALRIFTTSGLFFGVNTKFSDAMFETVGEGMFAPMLNSTFDRRLKTLARSINSYKIEIMKKLIKLVIFFPTYEGF